MGHYTSDATAVKARVDLCPLAKEDKQDQQDKASMDESQGSLWPQVQ